MKREYGQSVWLPPFIGQVKPMYSHPASLQALSDCGELLSSPESEIIHQGRNRVGVVFLCQKDGMKQEVVIKEFRTKGVDRLKSFFLPGKASKAWSGAHALLERSIKTPLPVAFLEEREKCLIGRSYYLSEKIDEVEEIRSLFCNLSTPELHVLLRSLARHLRFCHDAGVLHRDLSDGNILVKRDNQRGYQFFLIDTNRVQVKRRIRLLSRIKNLIRLGIPQQEQRFFLTQYLEGEEVSTSLWLWYRLHKWSYTWYIEMKKKLRLRQLAQKLRIQ